MKEVFRFDDPEKAIRIHRHDLPSPWINYLSNGQMHGFISQAGGGFSWWRSASDLRLTRYRQYHAPIDSPGPYVYLRHADGTVWSPTVRPVETPLDSWEAAHYPGRSVFTATRGNVTARLEYFIAPDHDVLVWDLTLENRGAQSESVDVFAFAEFDQHDAVNAVSWGYYQRHMLRSWFCEQTQAVKYLYHNFYIKHVRRHPLVYLASTLPLQSYSGDRDAFFGPYRSERNPIAVERNDCGNGVVPCGEACGALHNRVLLAPGKTQRVTYLLGVAPHAMEDYAAAEQQAASDLASLRAAGAVDAQRAKLQAWWSEHLGVFEAQLPDPVAARSINIWTPVNTVHTGRYSRSVNNLAPGIRGVGFRDTCQDMLSVAYRKPEWAAQSMRYLLSQQFEDGHAVHTAYPEEGKQPSLSVHSDDHLWLPLTAYAILAETGDLRLLDEPIPFLAKDASGPGVKATVWEHLLACVRFTESHLGVHKIPLTLASDWNDIIGRFARQGKGESVFAAQQYVVALRLLVEIAQAKGDAERVEYLRDCIRRQEAALLACAWNGQWWRRAFDDDGTPVGSAGSPFGKIFLNPQSWAVLAGVGDARQLLGGMDEARSRLDTGVGLKLIDPGFKTYPEEHDPFSGYGPGTGENGAIFCHANTWAIIAEARLGRADLAWKYFTQLIPENVIGKVGLERYQAEAYAWVSNIVGPENPRFGWGNVTQVTGTATWMDVAATQYLLGVRPEMAGLRLDPCLPASWEKVRVERVWQGCRLQVEIENPQGRQKGVSRLEVEGRPLPVEGGALLPRASVAGQRSLRVKVTL